MWKLSKTCSKKTATTVSQYMLGINFISTKSVDFAGNVFSWQFSCSICKKSLQERFHYFATVSINIRRSSHFCFEFCWRFSMLLTSNSAGPCFSWVRIWPSSFLKQTFPWNFAVLSQEWQAVPEQDKWPCFLLHYSLWEISVSSSLNWLLQLALNKV